MPYAYGYVRVSHIRSHKSGLSEEDQRRQNLAYWDSTLRRKGVEWGLFDAQGNPLSFEDPAVRASSRKFAARPQARQLMHRLRRGDHVIVALSSRAFRDLRDCLNTEAALTMTGVTLHCLNINWDTSTPTGRFMRHIIASVDEFQSGMLSDKNQDIANLLIAQGRCAGGSRRHKPYGFLRHPDNTLTPDHTERRVLEYLLRRHCVDRIYDRERIAKEIEGMAERGALVASRTWNGNKVKAAIAAFWRIVEREGVEWIQDARVRDHAVRGGGPA